MKKLLFILILFSIVCKADAPYFLGVNNGDLVTIGSTTATVIKINGRSGDYTSFTITVVSGTLKVGVDAISANAYAWPATSKIIISCDNGRLYAQAGSNTDTFAITAN